MPILLGVRDRADGMGVGSGELRRGRRQARALPLPALAPLPPGPLRAAAPPWLFSGPWGAQYA